MIRVGLDVRPLSSGHAWRGIGTYVRELRAALGAAPNSDIEIVDLPGRLESRWDRQVGFPRRARRAGVRILHVTAPDLPFWQPVPTVATLHDLIPLRFGDTAARRAWRWRLAALRRATRVIVYSEATARDAAELAGVEPDRIRVIPNGVGATFRPGAPAPVNGLPSKYLLYVGGLDPRKDIGGLLRAASLALAGQAGVGLVVLTQDPWEIWADAVRESGLNGRVIRLHADLDLSRLADLYRGAVAYFSASRYEGFGFPLLEAMACGTPVVAYGHSSHAEIVREGGVLVPDGDEGALAEAVRRVLSDATWRATLSVGALRDAARFSWERAARDTIDVYREIAA